MGRQQQILGAALTEQAQRRASSGTLEPNSTGACEIAVIGKRRNGSTRFWCARHHGDATEKYGRPAKTCRNAKNRPLDTDKVFTLNLDEYAGGIALWGA